MKIITNEFELETETWSDPGDYPSNAGSGPLPSYDYISDITGELIVELEDGETFIDDEVKDYAWENAATPNGITVKKWELNYGKNQLEGRVTITVASFEQD